MLDYGICRKCKKLADVELKSFDLIFNSKGRVVKLTVSNWSCPVVDKMLSHKSNPPFDCLYRPEQLMKAEKKNGK